MPKRFNLHKGYCSHFFYLWRVEIRPIQPTQIFLTSSCSYRKKLSAVSEKKEGDGFIGNELTIYNSEYIMTTPLEKQEYIIYKMMYPGLYILAGAPKIGKSWLALWTLFRLKSSTATKTSCLRLSTARPSSRHRYCLKAGLKIMPGRSSEALSIGTAE